jgi:antitoxin (DNA-binding transcriptional repressor) of toxin-antitoxin stability system
MARVITQRQLRNDSGEIMRELDRGESFIVTRNGAPVGELKPTKRRQFVPKTTVLAVLAGAARIDGKRFRADVDRFVDQSSEPRA